VKLSFSFVYLCHLVKNGRRAPISPAGEMWLRTG
jgi:hypothetical protein